MVSMKTSQWSTRVILVFLSLSISAFLFSHTQSVRYRRVQDAIDCKLLQAVEPVAETSQSGIGSSVMCSTDEVQPRQERKCGEFGWSVLDPTIPDPWHKAWSLPGLRVYYNEQFKIQRLVLPQGCEPAAGRLLLVLNYIPNWETYSNGTADPGCKIVKGDWLLLSDIGHAQDNLYEELSVSLYPAFLISKYLGISSEQLRLTHVEGNMRAYLAFPELYQAIGSHVPWEMLASSGATAHATSGCIEFETATTFEGNHYWWKRVGKSTISKPLTEFVEVVLKHLDLWDDISSKTQPNILYALRRRGYRKAMNDEEIIANIQAAAPNHNVIAQELSELPFRQQIQMVRQSAIYVFMHGGAGPHVIWLTPMAVAIEMFPYKFADPMYRNMAVLTGTIWLGWQNQNLSAVDWCGVEEKLGKRNSCTWVDGKDIKSLVETAVLLNSNMGI